MTVHKTNITWEALKHAAAVLNKIRARMTEEQYADDREALRDFITGYINTGNECREKQGSSISPIGATKNGGKCLKVRWLIPGGGKSGGLRLAVVAYCEQKRVILAGAWVRKDDPTEAEFAAATKDA